MRKFQIYVNANNSFKMIGSSNSNIDSPFYTYNENLNELENDQYNLTFSLIARTYTNNIINKNPFLPLIFLGNKIKLIVDGYKTIVLIIKQITPKTKELNTEWTIVAQDELSFLWSKHNITQLYSTVNKEGLLVPKNIFQIAEELLQSNWLTDWRVNNISIDEELSKKQITLDNIQNNPYQIIIEACNTVGAYLSVDFDLKIIDFYRKNLIKPSGYVYYPDRSSIDYSVDYINDELVTWLHVHGGEDANGNIVTIIPNLPLPVKALVEEAEKEGEKEAEKEGEEGEEGEKGEKKGITWETIFACLGYDEETNSFTKEFDKIVTKYIDYSLTNITNFTITDVNNANNNATITADATNCYFGIDPIDKTQCVYLIGSTKEDSTPFTFKLSADVLNSPTITDTYSNVIASNKKKYNVIIYRSPNDIYSVERNFKDKLKQEFQDFIDIGKQVPYLGQYLIDFSPFKHNMTKKQWDELNTLIMVDLFHYNLKLQFYTEQYYHLLILIQEHRFYLEKVLGEQYLAACTDYMRILKELNDNTDPKVVTALQKIKEQKQAIISYIQQSGYCNALQEMGYNKALDLDKTDLYWKKLIESTQQNIRDYMYKINNIQISSESNTGSISYYKKLIEHSEMMSSPIFFNDLEGLYYLIDRIVQEQVFTIKKDKIGDKYNNIESYIQLEIFRKLYTEYGQFIYEGTYENEEELDSIALYNQAITYFADLNRAQSSHSLSVLDIGTLSPTFVPRLSAGSLIAVYNPDSIQILPYADYFNKLNKIKEDYNNLYKQKIKYTYDEVLEIKKKQKQLQKDFIDADSSLQDAYEANNNITGVGLKDIEKDLFHDKILVTGIDRVLREPMKDSVTVEQSSRYKSILAKLIKSI